MPDAMIIRFSCNICNANKQVSIDDPTVLVSSDDSGATIAVSCPTCESSLTLPHTVLGCVSCRQAYSVADLLLGSKKPPEGFPKEN